MEYKLYNSNTKKTPKMKNKTKTLVIPVVFIYQLVIVLY